MKRLGWLMMGALLLAVQGCGVASVVGSTASLAVDVVSIPVKVVGAGVVGDDDDDDDDD
ncbi:hypothetical protein QCD60_11120 [Pokkaliibacter sp. MBI-7]|uniref:hypothetical protein n=1 Tax=Pokkaliibacter sp. MBI-7 TaxID=3040600 RepID=UPI00244CE19B|nr:hypothetical protein [Pokkaliibacter sp. MBI-7]MDH2433121.1 hypothetical protein [Pokkaliibacter sp. MBI-7]